MEKTEPNMADLPTAGRPRLGEAADLAKSTKRAVSVHAWLNPWQGRWQPVIETKSFQLTLNNSCDSPDDAEATAQCAIAELRQSLK